ncbi:MAG: S-(hydroxymethyl)glutathione dehydrogenase / alcohol dehydrogenase [Ilumatobacteraceae bacterium]
MRAAVLRDGSDQLDLADVDHDNPIGREVLVRSVAAGLCHSDYHYLDGTLERPRPVILGHEGAGIVEAVGPDVRDIGVGDHVVTCLVMGCGECPRCLAGEPARCLHPESTRRPPGSRPRLSLDGVSVGQMANVGSLADHILLDERAVTAISADIPLELACILGCAVVTGLGAVLNTANVQPGESVVVIGCGGVGLNVIQGARLAGASPIIGVDANPDKLARARQVGATETIDASAIDAIKAVREITGTGADHAFEVVGRPALVRQAFDMVGPGRTAYVLGIQSDDAELILPVTGFRRGKRVVGVFMGDTDPRIDIPKYAELWRAGTLDLSGMVSHTLPLEEVNHGFAMMAAGESARTVIRF